ncbi:MAG: hypothetical protein WCF33_04045 [Pseudonocardiaceae bacterium]
MEARGLFVFWALIDCMFVCRAPGSWLGEHCHRTGAIVREAVFPELIYPLRVSSGG